MIFLNNKNSFDGNTEENFLPSLTLTLGVIIPVYNSGREAFNAIMSVVAQRNVIVHELIIVDDGSSDGSADFIKKACENLVIQVRIFSTSNGGAANARNFGMNNCSCDLYAFLDSDDIWLNNKLERQINFFKDASVGMVGCLTTMGKSSVFPSATSGVLRSISLRQQLFKNYFQTSTVIVRRRVVDAVGPFPVGQRHAEEGDFFNRIAARYKCILVPECLVDYGGGKEGYGASGLSANLFAMEKGELHNIIGAYKRGDCSFGIFTAAICFSLIKFLRRIIITGFRQRFSNV